MSASRSIIRLPSGSSNSSSELLLLPCGLLAAAAVPVGAPVEFRLPNLVVRTSGVSDEIELFRLLATLVLIVRLVLFESFIYTGDCCCPINFQLESQSSAGSESDECRLSSEESSERVLLQLAEISLRLAEDAARSLHTVIA